MASVRVVFLDRDGTINEDVHYPTRAEQMVLLEGAGEAIKHFNQEGFAVIVVSNQSAVGRGMASKSDIEKCNQRLEELLFQKQAKIDWWLYCPHRPEENCDCRKPKTGMLSQVEQKVEIAFDESWVVGDKLTDLQFGENLGIPKEHCILVMSGKGLQELEEIQSSEIPVTANSLLYASRMITKRGESEEKIT